MFSSLIHTTLSALLRACEPLILVFTFKKFTEGLNESLSSFSDIYFGSSNSSFKSQEIFKSLFSVFYMLIMHYLHFHREIIKCKWFYDLLYFLVGKKDFLL